jgi:hypothetical protein
MSYTSKDSDDDSTSNAYDSIENSDSYSTDYDADPNNYEKMTKMYHSSKSLCMSHSNNDNHYDYNHQFRTVYNEYVFILVKGIGDTIYDENISLMYTLYAYFCTRIELELKEKHLSPYNVMKKIRKINNEILQYDQFDSTGLVFVITVYDKEKKTVNVYNNGDCEAFIYDKNENVMTRMTKQFTMSNEKDKSPIKKLIKYGNIIKRNGVYMNVKHRTKLTSVCGLNRLYNVSRSDTVIKAYTRINHSAYVFDNSIKMKNYWIIMHTSGLHTTDSDIVYISKSYNRNQNYHNILSAINEDRLADYSIMHNKIRRNVDDSCTLFIARCDKLTRLIDNSKTYCNDIKCDIMNGDMKFHKDMSMCNEIAGLMMNNVEIHGVLTPQLL